MDKKVAIVTFRFLNFGTVLQSFGLQEALHKIGVKDVEILDFPNEGGDGGKKGLIDTYKEQRATYGWVKGTFRTFKDFLFVLRAHFDEKKDHSREKAIREGFYKDFIEKNLSLSAPMSCSDLRNVGFVKSLPYNCYIAGSDQIWNIFPKGQNLS